MGSRRLWNAQRRARAFSGVAQMYVAILCNSGVADRLIVECDERTTHAGIGNVLFLLLGRSQHRLNT